MARSKLHRQDSDHESPAVTAAAPRATAQDAPRGDGYFGSVGAQPLEAGTRGKMERSFGTSFGDVSVHPDSARAGGSTHALAEGNAVHFAPGRYQPGSADGDRLIAHELAHVVQQRGGGQSVQHFDDGARTGLLEVDADRAAERASRGESASVRFRANAGTAQLFESWEHHQLGMAGGDGRTVTLKCGITLTYGEVVAMSGDFYASPEALMNAPREEVVRIRDVMTRERGEAAGNRGHVTDAQESQNNHDYQAATDWREQTAYDGGGNRVTTGRDDQGNARSSRGEQQGTDAQSYLTLADNNSTHFSPDNVNRRWRPQHDVALSLAREAYAAGQRTPAGAPAQASGAAATQQGGAATHQESAATQQDSAAAQQICVAPQQGGAGAQGGGAQQADDAARRQQAAARAAVRSDPAQQAANADGRARAQAAAGDTQAATAQARAASQANGDSASGTDKLNAALLHDGFGCHFITDAFASGHLISGDVGRRVGGAFWASHQAAVVGALKSAANADWPHAPRVVVDGAVDRLVGAGAFRDHVPSICLKLVHDALNATPLTVANPRGDQWQTMGDGSLADAPQSAVFGAEAVRLSRQAIEETARAGGTADPYAAMQVVPSVVTFQGASMSVAAFATNPTLFEGFLAPLLTDATVRNPLYQKIRGNVGLLVQQGQEAATNAGRAVTAAGERGLGDVRSAARRGATWVDSLFR